MSNEELIRQVKSILEKEAVNENSVVKMFSDDVVSLAYQKMSEGITDILQNEEDPVVIAEILKNYLETTSLIENRNNQKQQILLKFFEQLNKYEQSRYF